MIMSASSEWIASAWNLTADEKYNEAREILLAIVEEKDAVTASRQAWNQRMAEIADAEECLATIAYISGDYQQAVHRLLQAITRSDSFRASAHLLAAKAHAKLGETELAVSKLKMVISHSDDLGFTGVALAELSCYENGRDTGL